MKQLDFDKQNEGIRKILTATLSEPIYEVIVTQIIKEMVLDEIVNHYYWPVKRVQDRYKQLLSSYHPNELIGLEKSTGEQRG